MVLDGKSLHERVKGHEQALAVCEPHSLVRASAMHEFDHVEGDVGEPLAPDVLLIGCHMSGDVIILIMQDHREQIPLGTQLVVPFLPRLVKEGAQYLRQDTPPMQTESAGICPAH